MNKNDQEFLVQKIRTQYVANEPSALDALKALDKKVKRPANLFGYSFGCLAAIIMGSGMSLVMTDLGTVLGLEAPLLTGILIGVVGLAMALLTWPIYKKLLASRRKRYTQQILELSDRLL